MGSNRGFNSLLEFDEILTPVDRGSGIVTAAQRQANALVNLGIAASGATAADLVAASLTGTDSSLDFIGQAAAQGGTIIATGGTSSTTGNAGGAVQLRGGLPGATGVGGAVLATGAIGGATSGAGGAVTFTGGAGTNGNAAGGAASLIGGLGQGSAAGGAITITSGAAGATGVAGAVNIAVGAATAGNGSSLTLTAGNGAGSTNSGGNINLVPGNAVSTGTPGEVQISGSTAGFIPIPMNYTASMVTQTIYTASRAVRVKSILGRVRVAGSGGACTIAFFKAATTVAVGSGVALHSGSYNIVGTADANQTLTLSATVSDVTLAAGDSIGYVLTGTPTSAVGNVTVTVVPV